MSQTIEQQVIAAIDSIFLPSTEIPLASVSFPEAIHLENGVLQLVLTLGFPPGEGEGSLASDIARRALRVFLDSFKERRFLIPQSNLSCQKQIWPI